LKARSREQYQVNGFDESLQQILYHLGKAEETLQASKDSYDREKPALETRQQELKPIFKRALEETKRAITVIEQLHLPSYLLLWQNEEKWLTHIISTKDWN
jgi:hypothetical protein